ncbi:MAG TPA: sulfite exporter TauE/SafE family protein [Opitutaceae bacterium]|jgi:hypothetical protein
MMHIDWLHAAIAMVAAFVAGSINSVAGGGTLVTFPTLVFLGLPPVIANATNTVGIWPGSVGSIFGFRQELRRIPLRLRCLFLLPVAVGGLVGAVLLRLTPPGVFDRLVPWLLFLATFLFVIQAPIQKRLRSVEAAHEGGQKWLTLAMCAQFLVAIYGGYFGAGMSIVMLSILGISGMTDILEMSAMTSLLSLFVNGVAGTYFACSGLVAWPYALAMAVGAITGGYGAAGIARKIGKVAVRRFVIFVGVSITLVMFVKVLRG